MKIGADGPACDAVDLAVKINRGVEVGGDGVRGQARVISITDRVVAPQSARRSEILVDAAKQVDVCAVACGTEPATRLRQRRNRRPGISPGSVLVSVRDSDVVSDTAETINIATLRRHSVSRHGDGIRTLLGP